MTTQPGVVILTTGGTIASLRDPESGAVRTAATPDDLLQLIPDVDWIARVKARQHTAVNSWNMTPPMMLELVRAVESELERDDVHGVVVTHGTDTVEETALLAHITLASEKPVAFVAAMRNLSEAGPDGPRNLRDAVRVAASGAAAGRGSMLVINETIHSARFVTKTNTVNPGTFASPHGGPLGEVTAVDVEFFGAPRERSIAAPARMDASVPIVKTWSGMDPALLRWHRESGVDGLVIEGSGAGNVPGTLVAELSTMVDSGIPVVLTSRCIGGPLAPVYGTGGASGGGHDLLNIGLIFASRFTGQKARIALLALLGSGAETNGIREWFVSA